MLSQFAPSYVVKSLLCRNASQVKIILNKQYPEVFAFLHPAIQQSYENSSISLNSLLLWKCPNGPDHEWSSSVKRMINRYNNSKSHSMIVNLLLYNRSMPILFKRLCE